MKKFASIYRLIKSKTNERMFAIVHTKASLITFPMYYWEDRENIAKDVVKQPSNYGHSEVETLLNAGWVIGYDYTMEIDDDDE